MRSCPVYNRVTQRLDTDVPPSRTLTHPSFSLLSSSLSLVSLSLVPVFSLSPSLLSLSPRHLPVSFLCFYVLGAASSVRATPTSSSIHLFPDLLILSSCSHSGERSPPQSLRPLSSPYESMNAL
mmetsp:Transcript_23712/g.51455  ORF Transcript_23712/g.51455 Transcript_23712/m.51455 type:complete len:124 (-) Transcript_23712:43-414(-)